MRKDLTMWSSQYRHIDLANGRELVVFGDHDGGGNATIDIYQDETKQSTSYTVELTRDEVARLALALASIAHPRTGH